MPGEIKADLESIDKIRKRLSVTVPAEEVDREFDRTYRELQKRMVLPGYRRGHVPMRLVRQMHQKDVREDVARELISRAYAEALKMTGGNPASGPEVKEYSLEEGRTLTFSAEFEARPDIDLPPYKGLPLVGKAEEVADGDVMKVLEDLRRKVAPVQDVAEDRVLREGDIAVIDFESFCGGEPIPGGRGEGYPLEIGSGTFIPGFEDSLMGLRGGEEKKFILALPADYRQAGLAGKEAQFSVKVRAVKERTLPPLDDDFARDVGDYAGLEELKKRIGENLAEVRERELRAGLKRQAAEQVAEKVDFELPPSLVKSEETTILRDYARRLALRGINAEEAGSQMEAAQADARKAAARNVKTSLVLEEIARREGIRVERVDLDRAVGELAERYKKPASELRREMIESGAMEGLAQALLEEKVLDFLVDSGQTQTGK